MNQKNIPQSDYIKDIFKRISFLTGGIYQENGLSLFNQSILDILKYISHYIGFLPV